MTGCYFNHILPSCPLNEDCRSQCYWSSEAKGFKINNEYSRVTIGSLSKVNKDSMQVSDYIRNKTFKGSRVKFSCEWLSGSFIYSMRVLIRNLSKDELPSNDFKVVHIKGLHANRNLDPREKEVRLDWLVGSNAPRSHFFN